MDRPDHAGRRDRVRSALAARGLDGVLITALVNVRYLTGYTGSNGALLLGTDRGGDLFATDGRYRTQAEAEVSDCARLIARPLAPALIGEAVRRGCRRVGYESHTLTVDELRDLAESAPVLELTTIERAVETLRRIKDGYEIDALGRACAIADRAFAQLIDAGAIAAGRSERAIARDLDARMLDIGADAVSFDTIVAAGESGAIPHHRPGARPVASGEFVTLDFGATTDGYHSDMTRTVVVGKAAGWQRDLYALVVEAQRAGVDAVQPAAAVQDVDQAARGIIEAAGYGEEFGHGLGHGVGLQIHEAPMLSATGVGTLEDRCVVTVEPGVYLPGRGGVRIEDTVVCRDDARQLLTTTTKDLLLL
ncbi:MAG: aminopeptidase P family protein [Mycobacteriales bacterium]